MFQMGVPQRVWTQPSTIRPNFIFLRIIQFENKLDEPMVGQQIILVIILRVYIYVAM
jgi:hypothetical protein